MSKRTVHQSVFDSPGALRVARAGHKAACEALDRVPVHMLDEGNPNHPRYELHLFGQPAAELMTRQYRAA